MRRYHRIYLILTLPIPSTTRHPTANIRSKFLIYHLKNGPHSNEGYKKGREDTTASTPKQPVAEELVNDMPTGSFCGAATEKATGGSQALGTKHREDQKITGEKKFWPSRVLVLY